MERRKAPGDQITEVIPGNGDTDTFCLSSSILLIINLRSCCVPCVIMAGAHSASSSLLELAQPFNESCGEEEKYKVPETRADKKGLLNCQLRVGPFTPRPLATETRRGAESVPSHAASLITTCILSPETAVTRMMYLPMPHILTWSPSLYPASSRKLSQCLRSPLSPD